MCETQLLCMSESRDNPGEKQPANSKLGIKSPRSPAPLPHVYTTQDIILRERSTQVFLSCPVLKSEDWLKSKIYKESKLFKPKCEPPQSESSLCKKIVSLSFSIEKAKKNETITKKKRYKKKSIGKKRLDAEENAECLKPGPGILMRCQRAEQTHTGMYVLKGTVNQILTLERQDRMKANPLTPNKIRMLLESPFSDMSVITPHLGLTGLGGVVIDKFHVFHFPVKCIISVTYESPLFQVQGIQSYRVPVADDKRENISIYFQEVTDKIEQIKLTDSTAIVHCMAGVSRSASMVMAYLIRYEKMSLRQAFHHVKSRRSVVTPNVAFLEQLVAFESKHHSGGQLSTLVDHTINGITHRLPDFVITEWLNDYLPIYETE